MATAAKSEVRAPGPATAEEMVAWPDLPPGEIVDGEWVPKYPQGAVTGTGGWHGVVEVELAVLLRLHARKHRLGVILGAESAFRLRRRPDLVRCPDVAFVAAARLVGGVPKGVVEGAPDLAVEVLSPSNAPSEMERKIADYLAHGARAVWLVDPDARTVVVHAPGVAPRTLRGDETLDGGDVLPGFSTPASALFVDLDPPPTAQG